ncbi:MAG: hypothetical protein JO314_04320, partial [Acidobacteria bacterium]|nr:hypothetical protein [Acidobacteriota bacterium]
MNIYLLRKPRAVLMTGLTALCLLFVAGGAFAQRDRDHDNDRNNDHDGHHWRAKHGRYVTDDRGADLLRQAARNGYQQGYQAGLDDRNGRRRNNWRRNTVYMSADNGYDS